MATFLVLLFFFSSRRRHTRYWRDWSSDVCSSDLEIVLTMTISPPNNMFEWRHSVSFFRDVMNAVKTNPVVTDAAVIQGVPMRPGGFPATFTVEGMPSSDIADRPVVRMQ